MEVQRKTPYDAFWLILPQALFTAEAKHDFPGKASEAVGTPANPLHPNSVLSDPATSPHSGTYEHIRGK
jgi:hypothetical protein